MAEFLVCSEPCIDPGRGDRSRLERRPSTSLLIRLGEDNELCLDVVGGGGGGGVKASSEVSVKTVVS